MHNSVHKRIAPLYKNVPNSIMYFSDEVEPVQGNYGRCSARNFTLERAQCRKL